MSDFVFDPTSGDESPETEDPAVEAPNPDSLANPFLEKIPEEDRAIVAKYIKDWDSGVTKRFQGIHEQYRPYKDLGVEPDVLQQAYALMQMVNEDPQRVYDLLGQAISPEAPTGLENEYGDTDLPPAFIEKFTKMESILESLASRFLEAEEQQRAQQEDQQLNDYLGSLKAKHGDFDEEWVLAKMLKGVDGEVAVKQYNEWIQKEINSRMSSKRPVPVLGGGGAVPANGVDATKMKDGDVRALVAQMLESAAGQ